MRRIPELDGLRGLAALAVVLYHVFPLTFYFGWCGVELFFTLSGYLITTIVIEGDRSAATLGRFYWKRALRIMPLYFVSLFVVVMLNGGRESTAGLGWHLIYLQNIPEYWRSTPPDFITCFQPSWSVAAEEQFYACWPPLLLLLSRRGAVRATIAFLALCVFTRVTLEGSSMFLLFTRGDGIAVGCLLALSIHGREMLPHTVSRLKLVAALGAVYVAGYLSLHRGEYNPFPPHACYLGFSILFAGLIGLAVTSTGASWMQLLRWPIFRGLGTISYGMYLFHLPILFYSTEWFDRIGLTGVGREVAFWSLIFGLPTLSWFAFERPLLKLRNIRFPLSSASPSTRPAAVTVRQAG